MLKQLGLVWAGAASVEVLSLRCWFCVFLSGWGCVDAGLGGRGGMWVRRLLRSRVVGLVCRAVLPGSWDVVLPEVMLVFSGVRRMLEFRAAANQMLLDVLMSGGN